MGLDRWQMKGEPDDEPTMEELSRMCDYVAPPATPALVGLDAATDQIIAMLNDEYPGTVAGIFIIGWDNTYHLAYIMRSIWGEIESCSLEELEYSR